MELSLLDKSHFPVEELAGLRRFLGRLESVETSVYRNNIDVTESEINILKREIAYLDRVISSIRSRGQHI